jgi:hypothetical protein
MNNEPNAFDAAFAAAMIGHRMPNCQMNMMTRAALAGCAISELEAEGMIPEGYYEPLLDRIALLIRERDWPGAGVQVSKRVRIVLAGMGGSHD